MSTVLRSWLGILLLVGLTACDATADYAVLWQEGDIIFQTSRSQQSQAIQLATHSPYSHMGMLFSRDGKPYVYEAVQPVKYTPLGEWIKRGEGRRFTVKRLKNRDTLLTPAALEKMRLTAQRYEGKNYDAYFDWSDDKLYCSELVWKVYREAVGLELGSLQKISDFDLSHPAVQKALRKRYGPATPYSEPAIAPAQIFAADSLEIVYSH